MSLLGTGRTPQAGSSAEAEALIAEARARARRRRLRITVAVVGAAAVAAGSLAAAGVFSGGRPAATANGGALATTVTPAAPPPYFIAATSAGSAYMAPVIRASGTGKLVASTPVGALPDYDPPYGLAATGPDTFVVGLMTPSDCATQFFRFQVNGRGRPGPMTRIGPTLPGDLIAMAASAGGGLIGYAVTGTGCARAPHGSYLGVFDPATGRSRQWTDAPEQTTQLSMSADGRLLAFTQMLTKPMPGGGFQVTGYQVRVLGTGAAPGPVDARSRVAASLSPQAWAFSAAAVLLSPTGSSFYLCSEPFTFPRRGAGTVTDTASVVAYRTATGKATGVVASFAASYPVSATAEYAPLTLGCSTMALDPSGQFLLVPYRETFSDPASPASTNSLTAARINVATGARSEWTIPVGQGQGAQTMSVAW